jgi:hypothetical protein
MSSVLLNTCRVVSRNSCAPFRTFRQTHAWRGDETTHIVPRAFSTGGTTNDADVNRVPAVYTAYTVYKSKGAVSFKIIKPTWERTASGIRLSREGTMLLEFATGSGDRSYAWGSKGTFGLSASEIGDFLVAAEANEEWSAFHDPNMGGSSRGAVNKSLKLTPAQQGSWFLSLAVRGGSSTGSYSVPLSRGELRVISTCLEFALPRCLGLDEQFAGPPSVSDTPSSSFASGGASGSGGSMMPPF